VPTEFKELGQTRPSSIDAVSIFTPVNPQITALIKTIVVCNTSNASAKYSIYFDKDGTSYGKANALFFEQQISAKKTILIEFVGDGIALPGSSDTDSLGNLAVQTDTIDAITFSVFGIEVI